MKRYLLLVISVLLLSACTDASNKSKIAQEKVPAELEAVLEDVFEQKEIAKESDIELIAIGDDSGGSLSDKEKIAFLANNSNVFAITDMETFIIRTLSEDFKTLENPTQTFEWVIYSDKLLLDYLDQMKFDAMNRKMHKSFKQVKEMFVENIQLRDEFVQEWLNYSQGKKTKYTIEEIKLNLSDESLYQMTLGLSTGLALIVTDGIGDNDVSNYTKYGHEQIDLANKTVKKMQVKYYDLYTKALNYATIEELEQKQNSNEEESTVSSENNVDVSIDIETESKLDNSNSSSTAKTNSIMYQIEDSQVLYDYYDSFRNDYARAIEVIDYSYIEDYFNRGSEIASDYEKFVLDHHHMNDYNYEFLSNELYYYEFIDENTVNAFAREEFNFYSATDGGYYYNRDKRYIIKQENDHWYIEDIQIKDTVKERI